MTPPAVRDAQDAQAAHRTADGDDPRAAVHTAWWARVYEEWRLPVLRYVHRLTGDPHLAEDVAQEAFLRLMSAPHASPTAVRAPGSWLFRAATNIVRDAARRAGTRERSAQQFADDHAPVERPDHVLERTDAQRAVRAALNKLSERDREVLMMRQAGFDYAEIAAIIGIQPQSVPSVAMRALRRFKQAYEESETS